MEPKCLTCCPKDTEASSQTILTQAIDFINQYYKSLKTPEVENYLARLEEVTMDLDVTDSFQLTREELVFGARQAWRNAPRCIGRIQWTNLEVFDARKCKTTKDMFHFLCEHLKFATNGGNIRSAITIFPQRKKGLGDFRIWNSQLIKYAGYQMPDGSVQGDPSSLEFTKICIQHGWSPQFGRFDVLPLVLQAGGEEPDVFEIPPQLILEVPMEHPQYHWFEDLELRWYALPAVSSMMLEVGGLEFPACPFNGWYMGTEIGVRDFCDRQRYNILEEVACRMGLDTQNLSSLWKDQALVTVNVAVMHSFRKNSVTITDHHSAAESFMKHMKTEFRLRGGCPGDWVWLVPPMSGSLTPVFHQEMVNYILSPFFYYQPVAWINYTQRNGNPSLRPHTSFKALSRVVLFTSMLMKDALANRVRCTVLYATETGKSQTFAERTHSMFKSVFNSRLLCMADYSFSDVETENLVVLVTSTFGNGDCPGNGQIFQKHLSSLQHLDNKFRYCVFGLGSRMYPQFCAFAHKLDRKLELLGAKRVTPTGEGDELQGQEEAFTAWASAALKDACQEFNIQGLRNPQLSEAGFLEEDWQPHRYRVVLDKSPLDRIKALSAVHGKMVFPMKLKRRQRLQNSLSSRSTILVELEPKQCSQLMTFAPGDHVGVFPGNLPQLVAGILQLLPHAPPTNQSLQLEYCYDPASGGEQRWKTVERIPACPLSQALTYFLDVTSSPSQNLLYKLSQIASLSEQRTRLLTLAKDSQEYTTWKTFRNPTLLEVLEEFPSLQLTESFLLSQLPLLKPRLYSISSSPQLHPNLMHLTVAVTSYHTQGQGPVHHGVCSTWLDTIREGDLVPCFLKSSIGFHLPAEAKSPILFVGVGCGIAPFRSFWQQRLHEMKQTGFQAAPMSLLFGCQSPELDHLFRDEVSEMRRRGVLKSTTVAYSRQPGQPKVYVQDVLRRQMADEVLRLLHQDGGHLYVCGGVDMATKVAETVQEILRVRLGVTHSQAGEHLARLRAENRYHEDVFGVQFQK
ncbi:nitric oxide synthase 2b, inducible [Aplochiton taeniatus]